MVLKRFKKLIFKDNYNPYELNQFQENVASSIDNIGLSPIIDGFVLKDVRLISGDNNIAHKLDRTLIGWVIIKKNAAATIYDKQDLVLRKELFLRLNSDINVTVDIWVF